ncbi:dicarboxylate/amino acid:cation symporter [Undibacterium sp. SXout7W]|uniref:dicarboxylate/amino acid:cation symporter n=1 Tax=Undibacterium sp. SXout7W TaxID=3413049 RepID=UPI003BF35635
MISASTPDTTKGFSFDFLKSPIVILIAMTLGILTGLFFNKFSLLIAPVGTIYLKLLQMTIIPILMTALITSVGRLFSSESARQNIVKIIVSSLLFLFAVSLLALVVSLLVGPGADLSKEAQILLGKTLNAADQNGAAQAGSNRGVFDFLQSMIPSNVFQAMGEGSNLSILFFSLILGVATGQIGGDTAHNILDFTEALFKAMFKIISWIMYLLPFGLFALLAGQLASTGAETLVAMAKFVAMIWGISVLIILLNTLVLCTVTRKSPLVVLSALKESMLIAFGTGSTFASMPAAIDGLTGDKLKLSPDIINLVIPLGAVINRFSMIIIYTSATVFAAQLYGISLDFSDLALTLILSVLAATAGAGAPGIVSIAMVSIILIPLGLPAQAITILLLAINPIIDPIATMANIYTNATLSAVIAASDKNAKTA